MLCFLIMLSNLFPSGTLEAWHIRHTPRDSGAFSRHKKRRIWYGHDTGAKAPAYSRMSLRNWPNPSPTVG